jgi:Trk K+ transport system NAD-binding subunit
MNTEKRRRTAVPGRDRAAGTAPARDDVKPRAATLGGRLRYRFDLALARGPLVVVGYLGLIMLAIILLSAVLLTAFHLTGITVDGSDTTHGLSFGEAFWQSLLRVLDSGTFASDNDWPTRTVSLVVTISGIFLAGSLIGLIANAVDQQIEKLRKGRSDVLENNHTLVLGWSPRLPSILAEIVIANENHRKQALVVLADRAKDEMEDELRRLVPDTKTTRVVCRTGDIGNAADLHLVNVEGARSVIVLAGEQGDAGVVKAILAVRSIDPNFDRVRLVAELDDPGHADTLHTLTDGRIATVQADEVISQVTAQACHQSGLASVFRDLLDFDGDEIYFETVPELVGHTYGEAVRAFEDVCVIGLYRDKQVLLNPPASEVFAAGDEVIAIAADDDRIVFTGFVDDLDVERVLGMPFTEPIQRIALVGWSSLGVTVLHELDQFMGDGSVVDVLVDVNIFAASEITLPEYKHCTVNVHAVEAGPLALLEVLGEHRYDQAIVLGYRRRMDPNQADARTMLTLLALNRAWLGNPNRPRVVAEMLDRSNVEIAQTTGVDDFIVSDELSSLMIAQLSERLELQDVFAELFDASGCFVSLHPAVLYAPEHPTTFASVVASAAARGASALGYRLGRAPVIMNPPKSTAIHLGPDDQVLVLAPRAERLVAPVLHESITTHEPVAPAL